VNWTQTFQPAIYDGAEADKQFCCILPGQAIRPMSFQLRHPQAGQMPGSMSG
jgi:hypothetical protein